MPAQFEPDDQTGFAMMARQRPDAIYVSPDAFFTGKRQVIVDFATRNRLPLIAGDRAFTEAGGLMSYTASRADEYNAVADYVDRILRGAKPGDLPIQRPPKFELVVNLKTVKALGLTLPEAFLLRADVTIPDR